MSWLFQPLAPAAAQLGGPAVYNETGAGVFGAVASGAESYTGGGGGTTVDYQVSSSNGDSEQKSIPSDSGRAVTGSGTVSTTNVKLEIGSHSSGDEWSGAARFTGVAVPQGSTITSATFSLRADSSYSASPNVVKIYVSAEDSDNAPALSTTSGDLNASSRPRTTATTVADVSSITGGDWYDFDVTAVVQEIVDRAGWVSGNAWVFLVDTHEDTTTNEWQDWRSYNAAPADAPKITVTYGSGGGTTYTESGSGVCGFVASGADAATMADAGVGVFGAVASGAGVVTFTDAGGAVWGGAASGVGVIGFTETGAAVAGWVAAGGDVLAMADAGGAVWGALAAGADAFTGVDVGAGVFGWVATGAESYTPGGGGVYTETGAAVGGWVATGVDAMAMVDGGHTAGAMAAGGVGVCVWVDGGGAVAPWASGGQERQIMVDGAAVSVDWVASGAGALAMADGGAAVWGNDASGDDMVASPEPAPFPFVVRDGGRVVAGAGAVARDGGRQVSQGFNAPRDGGRKTR